MPLTNPQAVHFPENKKEADLAHVPYQSLQGFELGDCRTVLGKASRWPWRSYQRSAVVGKRLRKDPTSEAVSRIPQCFDRSSDSTMHRPTHYLAQLRTDRCPEIRLPTNMRIILRGF